MDKSFTSESDGLWLQNAALDLTDIAHTKLLLLFPLCEDILYTKITQEA